MLCVLSGAMAFGLVRLGFGAGVLVGPMLVAMAFGLAGGGIEVPRLGFNLAQASTAVARTQPLVEQPVMITVSCPIARSIVLNGVPKNADEWCLVITRSSGCGAMRASKRVSGSSATNRRGCAGRSTRRS